MTALRRTFILWFDCRVAAMHGIRKNIPISETASKVVKAEYKPDLALKLKCLKVGEKLE